LTRNLPLKITIGILLQLKATILLLPTLGPLLPLKIPIIPLLLNNNNSPLGQNLLGEKIIPIIRNLDGDLHGEKIRIKSLFKMLVII